MKTARFVRAVVLGKVFMKPASLVVFAILAMTFVVQNAMADTTFDGAWSLALNAHEYKNPDGSVARGVILHFPATGQSTPADKPYNQQYDEWVMLVSGSAGLWIAL
jgi:hypothetical protein